MWLFDYKKGITYEQFSQCEDYNKKIFKFLSSYYNLWNKQILEIGAGSGKFTSFLASMCDQLFVVEKSESLMNINQKKNELLKNIKFILDDIKNLNLPEHSVDYIFAGWSLTSMRNLFECLFPLFQKVLKKDGEMILVENAGNDEFCQVVHIENFTDEMKREYLKMGFKQRAILDTLIKLPNKEVFYNAFEGVDKMQLKSLNIKHKVLILDKKF